MNLASNIFLLFLVTIGPAASSVKFFNYTWVNETNPNYFYELAQPSGDDGVKPYVNCTELDVTHRRCEIFLGKFVPDRISIEKICVSDFHVAGFLNKIEAISIAHDKIAIAYSYFYTSRFVRFEGHHKYRILDSTSCHFVDTKEAFNFTSSNKKYFHEFGNVLLYEDGSFDLFKTSRYDSCDGGAKCKYSFNAFGYKIESGVPYLTERYDVNDRMVTPLGKVSRDRYVMLDDYFTNWGRNVKVVMASERSEDRELLKLILGYSAAKDFQYYHGYTAACWTDEFEAAARSTIHCRQFDSTGGKVLDVKVVAAGRVDLLKIQNLPVGGLLLLNNICAKLRACKDFQFRYIQNDGYVYQPIKIVDVGCSYAFDYQRRMKIWFGEFGNNCVASICDPGSISVRNLTTMTGACYPNQYLWSNV